MNLVRCWWTARAASAVRGGHCVSVGGRTVGGRTGNGSYMGLLPTLNNQLKSSTDKGNANNNSHQKCKWAWPRYPIFPKKVFFWASNGQKQGKKKLYINRGPRQSNRRQISIGGFSLRSSNQLLRPLSLPVPLTTATSIDPPLLAQGISPLFLQFFTPLILDFTVSYAQ